MVYSRGLKPLGRNSPCGFESRPRHILPALSLSKGKRKFLRIKMSKDNIINIVLFIVFLSFGTYFITIETWLLPIKIVTFIVLFLILKLVLFSKKQTSKKHRK